MHGIELINKNKSVEYWLGYIMKRNLDILEVGVSRDYGSSSYLVKLVIKYGVKLKLSDPNNETLQEVQRSMTNLSVNKLISYHQIPGEDLELKEFNGIGFAHLDGYDIVTKHKHKPSTIQAYEAIGHDLLNEGNIRSSISHFQICEKLIEANKNEPMLIILDDTWLQNGVWMGKGATAIPLLLSNGYTLISKPSASFLQIRKYAWGVAFIKA